MQEGNKIERRHVRVSHLLVSFMFLAARPTTGPINFMKKFSQIVKYSCDRRTNMYKSRNRNK